MFSWNANGRPPVVRGSVTGSRSGSLASSSPFSPEGFYLQQRRNVAKDRTSRALSLRFDLSLFDIKDAVKEVEFQLAGDQHLTKRTSLGDMGMNGKKGSAFHFDTGIVQGMRDPSGSTVEEGDETAADAEDGGDESSLFLDTDSQDGKTAKRKSSAKSRKSNRSSKASTHSRKSSKASTHSRKSSKQGSGGIGIIAVLAKKASDGSIRLSGRSDTKSIADDTSIAMASGNPLDESESKEQSPTESKALSRKKSSRKTKTKSKKMASVKSLGAMSTVSKASALTTGTTGKKKKGPKADKVMTEMIKINASLTPEMMEKKLLELRSMVKRKGAKRRLAASEVIAAKFVNTVLDEGKIENEFLVALVHGLTVASCVTHMSVLLLVMTTLRKVISVRGGPHNALVIGSGVVPRMVELLRKSTDPEVRFQVCWGLTNLARGTHDQTDVVVKAGTMPIAVSLIHNPDTDERVQHQAVWCIGNIAADCLEYRRRLAELGAIPALVTFLTRVHAFDRPLQDGLDKAKIKTGAWALYNLTRGCTDQDWPRMKPAIDVAAKLIFSNDQEVLVNGCWTLANLTDKNPEHVKAVIAQDTLKRLIRLLTYRNPKVVIPVIKAVGYYVLVGEETTQHVIDANALKKLKILINVKPSDRMTEAAASATSLDPAMDTRKLALWLVAHIAASNAKHVEAIFEAEVVEDVMALWKDETLMDKDDGGSVALLTEAAWVLCNVTRRGDHERIQDMVNNGYLDIIKWGLQSHQQRSVMIHILKGLWCTLAMGSRNRRCSCNEYFSKVYIAEIEPLVRAILENEEEKRVRQWCKVVVFMMDTSRTVIVKETTEHVTYWRPDAHKLFCTDFRMGVKTLLLCKERMSAGGQAKGIGHMTRNNFETMLGLVGNAWFCRPQLLLEEQRARPELKGKKKKKKRKGSDSSSDSSDSSDSDSDSDKKKKKKKKRKGSDSSSDSDSDSDSSKSDSDSDSDSDSSSGDTTDEDSDKSDSDSDDDSKSGSDSDDDSKSGSDSDDDSKAGSDSDDDKSDSEAGSDKDSEEDDI